MLNIQQKFEIDPFISLILKDNKTVIYVANEPFMICKYLLIINPHLDPRQMDIESIDEASEILSHKLESKEKIYNFSITPEEEFWGHCSNLQAWVELNYDVRIIHSNLAFSLMKKLLDAGDKRVKLLIKEEIARCLEEGKKTYVNAIIKNRLLNIFKWSEMINLILCSEDAHAINKLNKTISNESNLQLMPTYIKDTQFRDPFTFRVKERRVIDLYLPGTDMYIFTEFPEIITTLEKLKILNLDYNSISKLPNTLHNLKNLRRLELSENPIAFKMEASSPFFYSMKIKEFDLSHKNKNK